MELVKTEYGLVSGIPCADPGITVFKGIPYAAAPVGKRRWRAPEEPKTWQGIRDGGTFSPICPQRDLPEGCHAQVEFYRVPQPKSEDSLALNVWTPAKTPEDRLPVMMWIHGGAFREGSGSLPSFDGERLAGHGIVVVTINYRMGIFGFLSHPELDKENERGVSGNYGILDQIAALRWISRNIASFGGDPSCVTIAGQSAGAMSVEILLMSPLAKGLFHRAIIESGSILGMHRLMDKKEAAQDGIRVLSKLGASSIEELRGLPFEELQELTTLPDMPFWSPCLDGWLIPDLPEKLLSNGQVNPVPLLCGTNSNEATTMGVEQIPIEQIQRDFGDMKILQKLYPELCSDNSGNEFRFRLYSDRIAAAVRAFALLYGSAQPDRSFMYYFDKCPPGRRSEHYRAFHSAEIVYAFGTLDSTGRDFEKSDWELSEIMQSYWSSFVKNGDPNTHGLPIWNQFFPDRFDVMELGEKVGMKELPNSESIRYLQEPLLRQATEN